jgi:inositol transport system ATP-binding protein
MRSIGQGELLLQMRNVYKSFDGTRALTGVSLDIRAGEVHALMGENGAGKSTLMKILAGMHAPDSGEILLGGRVVSLRSPVQAIRHGIAMIHQELMPILDMTVAENLLLGREPGGRVPGLIDRNALRTEASRLLSLLQIDLPVDQPMRNLSVGKMQAVEIARALGREARIVIMDEPTSALSDREAEVLFATIRVLKQRGVAIAYITHKMDEVFAIADRVTVLRDGRHVATQPAADLDADRIIRLMVGRDLREIFPKPCAACKKVALSVRGLARAGVFREVSFDLYRGEVLGLAGLMGAGRTEVASAIFGLAPADAGEILVEGRRASIRKPADAIGLGIGMVTEDRKGQGIIAATSVKHNLTLAALANFCWGGFIRHRYESAVAEESIRSLAIRTTGSRQAIRELSGGNQQKVVIAKMLLTNPRIVILDEPTRGIDIGAKVEVYAIIARLAREGRSVILISSELPEIISLCDRVLVMRQGMLAAELDAAHATQEEILKHAIPE